MDQCQPFPESALGLFWHLAQGFYRYYDGKMFATRILALIGYLTTSTIPQETASLGNQILHGPLKVAPSRPNRHPLW